MNLQEQVADIWATGKPALYNLYESQEILANGYKILVEAIGNGVPPLIQRGETISAEISERVSRQLFPPTLPAMEVDVLVLDSDGNAQFNPDGSAITEKKTIVPEGIVRMLSMATPEVSQDEDMHCDQCGCERVDLFQIGDGWYCKVERTAPGNPTLMTCFDRRIEEMKRSQP